MLMPTAGSRLYICERGWQDLKSIPEEGWTEIRETYALGTVGVTWDLEDVTSFNSVNEDGNTFREQIKTIVAPGAVQIVMAMDAADPGQIMLWEALKSLDRFGFRMKFAETDQRRFWRALVVGVHEVFDTANSVMMLQADLQLQSTIMRE